MDQHKNTETIDHTGEFTEKVLKMCGVPVYGPFSFLRHVDQGAGEGVRVSFSTTLGLIFWFAPKGANPYKPSPRGYKIGPKMF